MCRDNSQTAFHRALTDPSVSKLRHDSQNKLCALKLIERLIDRTTEPIQREALRNRALKYMEDWNVAFDAYQTALHSAFERYEREEHEEPAEEDDNDVRAFVPPSVASVRG